MPKAFLEIHSSILGSIREPLIVLDPDLKVVTANDAFYQTFDVKPEHTESLQGFLMIGTTATATARCLPRPLLKRSGLPAPVIRQPYWLLCG
jgi:PAS domain-containing protein